MSKRGIGSRAKPSSTNKPQRKTESNSKSGKTDRLVGPDRGPSPVGVGFVSSSSSARTILICLVLGLATFAAYSRCFANGFINYDDNEYITQNAHLQSGVSAVALRWAFTTFEAGNWHPITWISHALDIQIFGLSPGGHHFHSVLLHAINAMLLFLLLWKLLLWKATESQARSLAVAALFALHPLNVETVAWAAERKSLLSTLFFFLAIAAYGWYAKRPSTARYGIVFTMFALGLMAKPMVITLPFVLLLLDYWPLRRLTYWTVPPESGSISRKTARALFLEKVPLLLLSAASAVVTLLAQHRAVVPLEAIPFTARFANALNSYVLYLYKALFPVDLGLFYPRVSPQSFAVILSVAILTAITLWVWRERGSSPYLLTGWFWYLGTLVPVIGLLQVGAQAMADRYAYIPLIGIFVAIVWRVADAAEMWRLPRWVLRSATAAILLAFAVLTWRQAGFWKDSIAVWTHTLAVQPRNVVAEDKLGLALMDAGQDDLAIEHFQNAIRIQPEEPKAHLALGSLLLKRGDLQPAIAQFRTASSFIRDRDDLVALQTNLGVAYREAGDYDRAADSFGELLKLEPSNLQVMSALGRVQLLRAATRLAHELDQHPSTDGLVQLGSFWEQAGDAGRARLAYQSALALKPNLAAAQQGLRRLEEPIR